ncbi:PAS and ANTAR domain-containing protein [Nocardia ninae]|uniref:histidine kinase n=1 Tax=Nocardia ninae NBRC 108245 TaxID=1210091 RepID=A0A511M662_9NOCA|nr:PAS and ANTAR domain-containing protein [Nocardia ninae]GEM36105.1 putative transcription antitermination regulator [Nocardia ninae NBRC 108245]
MRTGAGSDHDDYLDGVERVVGAGTPLGTGGFRFWFADRRWEWSDELARMHGYAPGEVEPTTELLLAHKHPDDRDRVEAVLVTSVEDDTPFSSSHRIIDTAGAVHQVIVVSEPMHDEAGQTIGTVGFYVDITETLTEHHDAAGDGAADIASDGHGDGHATNNRAVASDVMLPELLTARAAIEQAKGVLMVVYRINAEQAFRVLRWRSQETNTKLRVLAEQLITGLDRVPAAEASMRSRIDHLLLTAHKTRRSETA